MLKKYGYIISKLRKENNLTQKQLGEKLNVSYQAVSKWEKDLSQPDINTIREMAKIFKISITDFLKMVDESNGVKSDESDIEKEGETIAEKDNNVTIKEKKVFGFKNFKFSNKGNRICCFRACCCHMCHTFDGVFNPYELINQSDL